MFYYSILNILLYLHKSSTKGVFFFFQAEDGIRDYKVTGVQTCALPICDGCWGGARRGAPGGGACGRPCDLLKYRSGDERGRPDLLASRTCRIRSVGRLLLDGRRRLQSRRRQGALQG